MPEALAPSVALLAAFRCAMQVPESVALEPAQPRLPVERVQGQALTQPMASQQPAPLPSRAPWLKHRPKPVLLRPQASEQEWMPVAAQRLRVAEFRTPLTPARLVSAPQSAVRRQWVVPQLVVPQLPAPETAHVRLRLVLPRLQEQLTVRQPIGQRPKQVPAQPQLPEKAPAQQCWLALQVREAQRRPEPEQWTQGLAPCW